MLRQTALLQQQLHAQVVVLLILLAWWQDLHTPEQPYEVLEYYAGVGRIAAMSRAAGFRSAAVDIDYGKDIASKRNTRPPMDMNSNAGFLRPDICLEKLLYVLFFKTPQQVD